MTKILLVDDSTLMRKQVAGMLWSELNIREDDIVQVSDGWKAIIQQTQQDFDIILLDLHMAGMNGVQVLEAIREEGSKTPVLMITSEGDAKMVASTIQAGANDYILKPFEADILLTKVRRLLENAETEAEV